MQVALNKKEIELILSRYVEELYTGVTVMPEEDTHFEATVQGVTHDVVENVRFIVEVNV